MCSCYVLSISFNDIVPGQRIEASAKFANVIKRMNEELEMKQYAEEEKIPELHKVMLSYNMKTHNAPCLLCVTLHLLSNRTRLWSSWMGRSSLRACSKMIHWQMTFAAFPEWKVFFRHILVWFY